MSPRFLTAKFSPRNFRLPCTVPQGVRRGGRLIVNRCLSTIGCRGCTVPLLAVHRPPGRGCTKVIQALYTCTSLHAHAAMFGTSWLHVLLICTDGSVGQGFALFGIPWTLLPAPVASAQLRGEGGGGGGLAGLVLTPIILHPLPQPLRLCVVRVRRPGLLSLSPYSLRTHLKIDDESAAHQPRIDPDKVDE